MELLISTVESKGIRKSGSKIKRKSFRSDKYKARGNMRNFSTIRRTVRLD